MERDLYSRFRGRELTLSDFLAIDRTILANERTLLAYGRTSLAMALVGGTLIKFFDAPQMWILGGLFLLASFALSVRGWFRYVDTRRLLAETLKQQEPDRPEQPGEPF